MAKKASIRTELLERWRAIQEEADEDDDRIELSKRHRIHNNKEDWFADTFHFLMCLPQEDHIWCGSWDLMGPLLETFYNYFTDENSESPLRQLWRRISKEMQQCIQCICQHHQTQETYSTEYELSSIEPLLDVLQRLDEERVTQHLIEMNSMLARKEYDPARDNAVVVSVMYEVLMFPVLLDDGSLFTEFEKFIEAVDNMHELALAGQQHFPGVYALFFFKRSVRSVGHRLADSMGKLRRAVDLEPVQPLLKRFICLLETEVIPSTLKTLRPRVQLDRTAIWIGVKTLLGFLEPPAFEEGILERYPSFLDIVVNHISGDLSEFSHAVACLRKILEMLGCKLWLRSTLAPGVMSDTLLGQCFHTRNEKSHKDIFDLFQPFLQSLEALQDGEHEKQRRHFLYFLLHQVTVSSNFSALSRQRACQISLLIVHRGYTMNPPCPPFECAHMWGPSLVSSLKDSFLHSSLRKPAFYLMQTIIVSDAAALISYVLNMHTPLGSAKNLSFQLNDEDEDEDKLPFSLDTEKKDTSSWSEFSFQSRITSQESMEWMCIPMLWIDVLVDTNLSDFPISFSKAVFWARSRFSMVEPETSAEMALPFTTWLSSSATEICPSLGWKIPTGSDDGGEGKESKNSIKVSTLPLPLVRMFNRLTAHYVVKVGQGELCKQWTWEPRMGESLFLALIDPDDNVRQFGKCMLEQVSNTRGLSCGLNFLCSHQSSLSAVYFGLRHAVKLVQLDTVTKKFQTLHHFFFVLRKLLDEGDLPTIDIPESDHLNMSRFSSQGGFLRRPLFDPPAVNVSGHLSNVDSKSLGRFCYLLSETAWPSICRCLLEGKAFINHSASQMTCVRILEIIPCVFERLYPFCYKPSGISGILAYTCDFSWLHDIMVWGKSSLKVVVIYWQRTISSLLKFLKGMCNSAMASTINVMEQIISCDCVSMDELMEQVSLLSVSLSNEASSSIGKKNIQSKGLLLEGFSFEKKYSVPDVKCLSIKDPHVDIPHSSVEDKDYKSHSNNMIVLSDDETEVVSPNEAVVPDTKMSLCVMEDKTVSSSVDKSTSSNDSVKKEHSGVDTSKDSLNAYQKIDATVGIGLVSQKQDCDKSIEKPQGLSVSRSYVDSRRKDLIPDSGINDSYKFKDTVKSLDNASISKKLSQACNNLVLKNGGTLLKQMTGDEEEDPLDSALNAVRRQQSFVPKLSISAPKRQLIQLQSPSHNRAGHLHRLESRKRFQPPRLDEWYRRILAFDYFALVGVAAAGDKNKGENLKEVPVSFQSPEQYIGIFCPLVLEEFKAQLHSSFLEMSSWEEVYFGSLSVVSVERIDDFHLVRFNHDVNDSLPSSAFSENDLVLLTKEPPQKLSHDVHMLGKVEKRERDDKRRLNILLIRFYLLSGTSRLHQARKNLHERSKWHASRVMNITSQIREFQALSLIKDIPLLPIILKPVNDSHDSRVSKDVVLSKLSLPLERILKSSFNDSQLQAISMATGTSKRKKDFYLSLIQGPPGTGKTRTILAIVSALLASPVQKMDFEKKLLDGSLKQISVPKINQAAAIARAWQDAALARQLNEDVQRNTKSVESSMGGRVLICAQSNAAVDELVARISSLGLFGIDGKMYKPYLVRVGNVKTVHPNSLPFFLDTIVDQRLADEKLKLNDTKNDLSLESSIVLRANLEKLVDRIKFYEAKRANLSVNLSDRNTDCKSLEDDTCKEDGGKETSDAEIAFKLRKLYAQKKQIYMDLSSVQQKERKINEEIKGLRYKLRRSILREAQIVVATLSGCGGDLYGVCSESLSSHKLSSPSEHTLFDAVVIDEAAQALEPATLIPLQLLKSTGTKCIMVGDPKQLPATVLSSVASKFLFECSMFERLQRAGHPVIMLTKQYRMHPDICMFPSMHFYEKKLLNGDNMSSKSAPFHETRGLGPYIFYDVIDGRECRGRNSSAMSLYNEHEADAAVELLKFFKKRYPSEFHGGRIGIITPYKSQLALLRSRFSSAFGSSIMDEMELNTVDSFQGREVDILILSTVRAADPSSAAPGNNSSSIGFVADIRRMNVALTRAKLSLWILGNGRTLQTNQNWGALVKDARKRNLVITIKPPYKYMVETGLQQSSGNHLSELRRSRKIHDGTWHAKTVYPSAEDAPDRRTSHICPLPQRNRRVHGGDKDFSGAKDVRAMNVTDGEILPLGHKKVSKDDGSAIPQKYVTDGETADKESRKRKKSLEDSQMEKKVKFGHSKSDANNSEQRGGDGRHPMETQDSKRAIRLSEGDRHQTNQMKNASDGGRPSNQSGSSLDLIAKRKQQREAVDAILYSSLIPSKSSKSDTSIRPVPAKRPGSSSTAGGGIKPAKTRKD